MDAQQIADEFIKQREQERGARKVLMALLSFGITEGQLARQLGFTTAMISQWKSGYRPINDDHLGELYELLREFIKAKPATIALLKRQRQWDVQTRKILNDRFKRAGQIYSQRPARFRHQEDDGAAA